MLKEIYSHLKAHLKTIPEVEDVDWYLEQYIQEDESSLLYTAPALFIEFAPISYINLGKDAQRAVLDFTIHVVTDSLYDDDTRMLDADIDHLGLVDGVFAKLHKHRYVNGNDQVVMETIERVSIVPSHIQDVVIVTTQLFRCNITDYVATPQTVTAQVDTVKVDVEIEANQ